MKRLPFTLRLASASRLALLLVGFCCLVPSARAADDYSAEFPPDTFPYEAYYGLHVLITGAYEQVWIVDDIAEFHELAGEATNRLLIVAQYCAACGDDLSSVVSYADDMASRYPDIPVSEWGFINALRYWSQEISAVSELCSSGVSFVDNMAHSPQLANVLSRAVYTADGDLSGFDGSGGCDCAEWLQDILAECQLINTRINSWIQNIYYRLYSFTRGANSVLGVTGEDYASRLGVFVGTNLLYSSTLGARLEEWLSMPVYDRVASPSLLYGEETADSIAAVLTGFEQLFMVDSAPSGYPYGPYVEGMRDFALTKNNHPTNTIDNPLWVAFTNSVTLSSDLRFDPSVSLSVVVTNFADFISGLENANLYVNVTNTVNVRVDTQSQRTEFEGMLGDADEPDEDTIDYEPVDFSSLSSVGSSLSGVFSSYAGMFSSIPDEMPQRVFIHEGWTLGFIEVPSIHWNINSGGVSRGFSLIRGCFSAVWVVLYLVVIAFFAAVDIFVAGVCLYCCYGLLAGDSKTALHGVRHMFNLLCGFLGFKAPSSGE